jgi:hypothetical protein
MSAPAHGRRFGPISLPAAALAIAFAVALAPMGNNDLWWHLTTGRWIVAHHRLPVDDPFSFTVFMRPWHDVEWLSEIVMYGVHTIAGDAGLVVGAALCLAAIFGLVFALARETSGSDGIATAVMIVAALRSHYWWAPRPTLASDLGALLTLLILERARSGNGARCLWALPAIAALWANLHGGFILAPVIVATVAVAAWLAAAIPALPPEGFSRAARRRLVIVAALVPLALLANANGTSVLAQSAHMFGAKTYRFLVDEWTWPDLSFVVAAWSVTFAAVVGARRPIRLSTLGLALGLTALATSAHRFELYFGLLVLPILAALLADRSALSIGLLVSAVPLSMIPGLPLPVPAAAAVVSLLADRLPVGHGWRLGAPVTLALSRRQAAALLIAVLLVTLGFARSRLRVDRERYPVGALDRLAAAGATRVFNLYSWGGWMLWTTKLPTFIDGRSWGGGIFEDYAGALGGAYEDVFARYDVRFTLLPPETTLNRLLEADPAWEKVDADARAVVFRKRTSAAP